jgi:hypothetical protein
MKIILCQKQVGYSCFLTKMFSLMRDQSQIWERANYIQEKQLILYGCQKMSSKTWHHSLRQSPSPYIQIYDAGMYNPLENKYVKSTELMKLSRIISAWHDCTLVN